MHHSSSRHPHGLYLKALPSFRQLNGYHSQVGLGMTCITIPLGIDMSFKECKQIGPMTRQICDIEFYSQILIYKSTKQDWEIEVRYYQLIIAGTFCFRELGKHIIPQSISSLSPHHRVLVQEIHLA